MLPEAKLIQNEFILRELLFPEDTKLARKSLIRWIALSLGLILPNESRHLLLDILDALIYFHVKKESPTTHTIIEKLEEQTKKKANPKAVYYHLLRLKELGIISRKKGRYYFGNGDGRKLSDIFREFYVSKTIHSFININEALDRLETSY